MASLARADLESLLHTKKLDRTLTRAPRARAGIRLDRACGLRRAAAGRDPARSRVRADRPAVVGAHDACCCSLLAAATRARRARRARRCARHARRRIGGRRRHRSRSAALDPRLRRAESRAVPRSQPARARAGRPRTHARARRPASSAWWRSMRAKRPADAIRRLPFTTWLRLQRMVEGTSDRLPARRDPIGCRAARAGSRCTPRAQERVGNHVRM